MLDLEIKCVCLIIQTLLQPLLPPPQALCARISSTTVRHMVNPAVPDSLNPGRVTTAVSTVDSVVRKIRNLKIYYDYQFALKVFLMYCILKDQKQGLGTQKSFSLCQMSLANSLQMLKCLYFTLKKCAIKNVNIEKDYCSVEYLRMLFF